MIDKASTKSSTRIQFSAVAQSFEPDVSVTSPPLQARGTMLVRSFNVATIGVRENKYQRAQLIHSPSGAVLLDLAGRYWVFFNSFLGSPAAFLAALSPSASHLLAFTICTTLIYCFAAIIGALTAMQIQGTVESILFARAISIAPAENGEAKRMLGLGAAGVPGAREEGLSGSTRSVGLRYGEEKESK